MKVLSWQARRFGWTPHSRTLPLPLADETASSHLVEEAVVAFLHVESGDEVQRSRVFRHVLKHLKWLANKRGMRTVVLHSFAHLGGDNSDPAFARDLLRELAERLERTGYQVHCTPFGWFCAWELSVYGDSLAKVWKQV